MEHGACAIHHPLPEETRNLPLSEKRLGDPDNGPPLFERARRKAAPVEEFQWLRLMLFAAIPFPGTGAWTGAIIASVLGMSFWSGLSANFVGVVLAGLLVNLLMNLGLKHAIGTGVLLIVSTVMWGALRGLKKSLNMK